MAPKNTKTKHGARPPQQNQNITSSSSRPRLTHFLCLPLVNSTSIPQLISSLAEFRDSIPLVPPPVSAQGATSAQLPHTPLFPDGALRPLGTLHLTLGVMSLPTKERLEEALEFFQSLDLESMLRDVEIQATASVAEATTIANTHPQPLLIDLTSLHALPKAKAATILHAQPVDSTSRLYPFCVNLRNKFIDAGFIEQEMIKRSPRSKNEASKTGKLDIVGGPDSESFNGNHHGNNDNSGNIGSASSSTQVEVAAVPKAGKPRPLLLHATIANTVYLPRRKQRDGKRKETFKFDARQLLMEFGDYVPSSTDADSSDQERAQSESQSFPLEEDEDEDEKGLAKQKGRQRHKREKPPFVWARDIPIDRVCICEMGAKPVTNDGGKDGSVLGEAYVSVRERSLVFAPQVGRDGDGDDGDDGDGSRSEDGGVSVI